MSHALDIRTTLQQWSPRARLYGMALAITLCYLLLGRFTNDNPAWVQVSLPLSSVSILMLGVAGAEMFLFVKRTQERAVALAAARHREIELSQHLAFHRQTTLNQISRALIDRLDINQIPAEVLEKSAQLLEADLFALWVVNPQDSHHFLLRGICGLNAHDFAKLATLPWPFPSFHDKAAQSQPVTLTDPAHEAEPLLAHFCEKEKAFTVRLNPILSRGKLVGLIGAFHRQPPVAAPVPGTDDMQTVANLIASAIQAEELYHDLVQVQKIESIGTLASGIAHDFNNVLAAILGCATYVKQHTDPDSPTYRYLEATEQTAHRGAALTKQLLSFARRDGVRYTVINPNDIIDQTLKMLERSFDKTILIARQYAVDLRPVEVDTSQLEQVILNIAVNARDVMPDGGFFTITTRNIRLDREDHHRPKVAIPDGDYVMLSFADTGCGMDEATQHRIFEPFFTTKQPGKGTGIGLSVVLHVVKSFGGDIRVESKPGRGARFDIFLPATTKALPAVETQVTGESRGGHETVLVVEDEEVIREMAQLGLEAKGYKVLTAGDGAAALSRYRNEWEQVDIVVADMVMPRMSGPELFSHMKKINPAVRVIVSSGYSHDLEGQRMLQHGCLGFLQKPYNTDDLSRAIRSVLDSGL